MIRNLAGALVGAAISSAIVGCGSPTTTGTGNSAAAQPAVTLRPAEAARAQDQGVKFKSVALGQSATIPTSDGATNVTATVSGVSVGGDESGPWLVTSIAFENHGSTAATDPAAAIFCSGSTEAGGWQIDSTVKIGNTLPSMSVDSGTLNLLLPFDGRYGKPVPACAGPAVVRVYFSNDAGGAEWPIPDTVLADLNAKRHSG